MESGVAFFSFSKQRNIKYGLNLGLFSNMCNAESMLPGSLRAACPPFAVSLLFSWMWDCLW